MRKATIITGAEGKAEEKAGCGHIEAGRSLLSCSSGVDFEERVAATARGVNKEENDQVM
jgi:hypothetical protein